MQFVFLLSGQPSGSSFSARVTVNTWRAVDNNGLSATCSFSVTVSCGTGQPDYLEYRAAVLRGAAPNGVRRYLLSPNPAAEVVNVTWEGPAPDYVAVFDAQGWLVGERDTDIGSQILRLVVSEWAAGVYMVVLRTEGEMVAKRLVVYN